MRISWNLWFAVVLAALVDPARGRLGFYGNREGLRGESSIKIGTNDRSSLSRSLGIGTGRAGSGRGTGVRIGEGRGLNTTRQRAPAFTTTTSTTSPVNPHFTHRPHSSTAGGNRTTYLKVTLYKKQQNNYTFIDVEFFFPSTFWRE